MSGCHHRLVARRARNGKIVAVAREITHDPDKDPARCTAGVILRICDEYDVGLDRLVFFECLEGGVLARVVVDAIGRDIRLTWFSATAKELRLTRGMAAEVAA